MLSCQLSLSTLWLTRQIYPREPLLSLLAHMALFAAESVANWNQSDFLIPGSYLSTTKQGECFINIYVSRSSHDLWKPFWPQLYTDISEPHSFIMLFMIVQILDAILHRTDKTSRKENIFNLRIQRDRTSRIWILDQVRSVFLSWYSVQLERQL